MADFWEKWKRTFLALTAFGGLAFTLGFSYKYHLPRLKSWLMVEIEEQSQRHLPLRLWPQTVEIQILPPRIRFSEIRILPKAPIDHAVSPSSLDALELSINWLALFRGHLRLSEVELIKPHIHLKVPRLLTKGEPVVGPQPPKEPSNVRLKSFYGIPLDSLRITGLNLVAEAENESLFLRLKDANLEIENRFDAFLLDANLSSVRMEKADLPPLDLSFETRFLIDDESLQVSALKVKKQSSFLVASGYLKGELLTGGLRTGKLNSRTHFSLPELRLLAQGYLEKTKLPELKGSADVDLELKWEVDRYPDILFRTRTRDVMIDKFVIGALESEGVVSQENIQLKRLSLSNSAGRIHLHNSKIERKDEWKFSTTLAAEQLELRQLLMNVTVPETPLHLDIAGSLPCAGQFKPFKVDCKGQLFGSNLSVHSGGEDRFPIVDIEKFNAQGEVSVDAEKVTYKADLQVGENSKGKSDGIIGFKTGFNINYIGDHLDFKDVKNLAKLKLEGTGQVKGNTEGNSKHATIKMDIEGNNMWLGDFGLGRIESEMRYKEGVLTFRKMKGLFQTSRYSGNLSINLPKRRLYITGKFPYADLEDMRTLLGRHYLLPLPVSGTGSGEVKVWGPLVLNRLNFDLKSSFYRGSLAHESFDELIVHAHARDGNIRSDNIHLSKSSSRVTVNGSLSSGGHLDLVLLGRDLRLEQSENLEKLDLNMTGILDFTTSLRGPIRHPKTDLHGRLSRLVVADRPYEDSNFKMKFTSQTIQGGGNFMGDLIKTNFILPITDDAPFRLFVETKALNFTQLFNVFSGMANKKDFEARLTSTVDLRADRGGIFKSTGSVKIDDVLIRRGAVSMAAPKPIALNVKDGVVNSENFNLVGHSTYITLLAKDSSIDSLNVNVNGKVDMSLGLLFTPFLTDLRGTLSVSGQLKGKIEDPELLGSAFIDNGLVRIKNFPEAVEQVRADLLFSHKNILINAANGSLGGGPFTADGKIRINKFNEIPINIKGQFKDISLEVPNGVRT